MNIDYNEKKMQHVLYMVSIAISGIFIICVLGKTLYTYLMS